MCIRDRLEKETGKNVGFSVVSNIRLAQTYDRMDETKRLFSLEKVKKDLDV